MQLVEPGAPWSPDIWPEWTTDPVAQLRYSPTAATGSWRLSWAERNRRWHLVPDAPPAPSPTPLPAAIDANPAPYFG